MHSPAEALFKLVLMGGRRIECGNTTLEFGHFQRLIKSPDRRLISWHHPKQSEQEAAKVTAQRSHHLRGTRCRWTGVLRGQGRTGVSACSIAWWSRTGAPIQKSGFVFGSDIRWVSPGAARRRQNAYATVEPNPHRKDHSPTGPRGESSSALLRWLWIGAGRVHAEDGFARFH